MARPGLYDELVKLELLPQARTICNGEGSDNDKAAHLEVLLAEAGSDFKVTARAVYIVRHRLENAGSAPPETERPAKKQRSSPPAGGKTRNDGKAQKKEIHPHDGRRQNKGRPPPGPHSTAFKPGHDAATKTGEYRNPLLHAVRPERVALVSETQEKSPADLIRESIMVHQLAIADMTEEIEAIKASTKAWWWLGSTYTRQEGDGEIMGTGRISQRKRAPREEALKVMVEARARVQGKLDAAIEKLHKMLQDTDGKRKGGLADLLAAMRQGGDDD